MQRVPQGSVVLAARGNCTFLEKAANAARAGAAGIIVVNNSTMCLGDMGLPDANDTSAGMRRQAATLFIAGADNVTATVLWDAAAEQQSLVSFQGKRPRKVDPASLILLAMAVATIAVAAVWSGNTFKQHLQRQRERQQARRSSALEPNQDADDAGAVPCCRRPHRKSIALAG